MLAEEYVELVDDKGVAVGRALKSEVHTDQTPLHRAFSCYIFNSRGQVLLQQRSGNKKTWPLIWSNTCCGHPGPGEDTADAARRRLKDELGLSVDQLTNVLPYFRYRAELDGIVENELCPVFVGVTDSELNINKDEVAAIRWVDWQKFKRAALAAGAEYSSWCIKQVKELSTSKLFVRFWQENIDG